MGNGGILWIWMTIIISVVHLSPLLFDFDHLNENLPTHLKKLNSVQRSSLFLDSGQKLETGFLHTFLFLMIVTFLSFNLGLVKIGPHSHWNPFLGQGEELT